MVQINNSTIKQYNNITILGIKITPLTKQEILGKIAANFQSPPSFSHVVSLNPEIMVVAQHDAEFRQILNSAALSHIDGVGMIVAGALLGVKTGERIAGVDLMEEILELCRRQSHRVMFIGGAGGVAEKLAKRYNSNILSPERESRGEGSPQVQTSNIFFGLEGIHDISAPSPQEEEIIKKTVVEFNPTVVFVSFGSPFQEKWIYQHQGIFNKQIVMGVGGAFDFLSGRAARAPRFIRRLGFEWLFRLLKEPWRFKRQLKLLQFLELVVAQKFNI